MFDTEKALFQVILGLLLLSISVCRLRERGRVSKSVYVRVVHDLELLCSSLRDRTALGLIIIIIIIIIHTYIFYSAIPR